MKYLGAKEAVADISRYVSLVCDLGLMPIEETLAKNKGSSSPVESRAVKVHPEVTLGLLSAIDLVEAILHHHERDDGSGYPHGLMGEDIPLMARRPCANAERGGRLYDPLVIEAFGVVECME